MSSLKVNNNYGHGGSGFTLSSVADVFQIATGPSNKS